MIRQMLFISLACMFSICTFSQSPTTNQKQSFKYYSNLSRPFSWKSQKNNIQQDSVQISPDSIIIYNDIAKQTYKINLKSIQKISKGYLTSVWAEPTLDFILGSAMFMQGLNSSSIPVLNYILGGILLINVYPAIRSNRIILLQTDKETYILYAGWEVRKIYKELKNYFNPSVFQ